MGLEDFQGTRHGRKMRVGGRRCKRAFRALRKSPRNRLNQQDRGDARMQQVGWQWPGGKPIAVIFNVCLEAWSDGKAPGISPMGNPLPAGALDTMAISWASYGVKRGIYRLLDALA